MRTVGAWGLLVARPAGGSTVRHCRLVSLSLTMLCASLGFQLAASRTAGARLRPTSSGLLFFSRLVSSTAGGRLFGGFVSSATGCAAGSGLLFIFFGRLVACPASSTAGGGSHLHVPGSQIVKSHVFVLLVRFGRTFRAFIIRDYNRSHKYAPFCNYPSYQKVTM